MVKRNRQVQNNSSLKYVKCTTCTKRLVEIVYERAPWFRILRGPMILGMKALSWYHGINPKDYPVRTEECYGCVRFMKNALKDKSPAFVRLNEIVNPVFNRIRDSIVTEEEKVKAVDFARSVMNSFEKENK